MLGRYCIILINKNLLEFDLNYRILSIYFPELRKITFKKSIFGKFKDVKNNSSNKSISTKSLNKFFNEHKAYAKKKLSYFNLISEIARLQFIILTFYPRFFIDRSKLLGIKLPFDKEA
jgi:hypothetical protein